MRLLEYIDKNEMLMEASFKNVNLERAVKLLLKVLEKRVSHKFYPFGGKDNNWERFKRSSGNGIGMRFILDTGSMVRFNWESDKKSSTVTSIDVWSDMKTPEIPDATLIIPPNYNIVKSVDIIAKFIKNPKPGLSEAVKGQYGAKKTADAKKYGVDVSLKRSDFYKEIRKVKASRGVKETSSLTKEIKGAEKTLSAKKLADPQVIFRDLEDLITMVVTKVQRSLVISGSAGIGKTFSVLTICKKILGSEGGKWRLVKGKASPLGLYSELFLNRDKLLVFDDCDSVFEKRESINMLKAALDSYDERTVSWVSPRTIDVSRLDQNGLEELYDDIETKLRTDPTNAKIKFPNRFTFTGSIIFISNLNESKIDSAIKSRSFVIDITLEAKDIFNRMESILKDICPENNINEKLEVFNYIKKTKSKDAGVNIRTLINGIKCKASGLERWQHLTEYYA